MCLDRVVDRLFGRSNDYTAPFAPQESPRSSLQDKVFSCVRYFFMSCTAVAGAAYLFSQKTAAALGTVVFGALTLLTYLIPEESDTRAAHRTRRVAQPILYPAPTPPPTLYVYQQPAPQVIYQDYPHQEPTYFVPQNIFTPQPLPQIRITPPPVAYPIFTPPATPVASRSQEQVRVGHANQAPQHQALSPSHSVFAPPAQQQVRVGQANRSAEALSTRESRSMLAFVNPRGQERAVVGAANRGQPEDDESQRAPSRARPEEERARVGGANH